MPKDEPRGLSANDFQGVWAGHAHQFNTAEDWTVRITLKGQNHHIDYPSLNCGGRLTLVSGTERALTFREHITYGNDICVDGGTTVVDQTGEASARFLWYYENGTLGATGGLLRTPQGW